MGRILNGITVRRLWEKSGYIRLTVLIIPQWVRDDDSYLLSRAIQFYAGVPQVYYGAAGRGK